MLGSVIGGSPTVEIKPLKQNSNDTAPTHLETYNKRQFSLSTLLLKAESSDITPRQRNTENQLTASSNNCLLPEIINPEEEDARVIDTQKGQSSLDSQSCIRDTEKLEKEKELAQALEYANQLLGTSPGNPDISSSELLHLLGEILEDINHLGADLADASRGAD